MTHEKFKAIRYIVLLLTCICINTNLFSEEKMLTVRETYSLVFAHETGGKSQALYKYANPAAEQGVLQFLGNHKLELLDRIACLSLLGIIGSESSIDKMVACVVPIAPEHEIGAHLVVSRLTSSLGLTVSRNNKSKARQYLTKMTELDYWKTNADKIVARSKNANECMSSFVVSSVQGIARSGDTTWLQETLRKLRENSEFVKKDEISDNAIQRFLQYASIPYPPPEQELRKSLTTFQHPLLVSVSSTLGKIDLIPIADSSNAQKKSSNEIKDSILRDIENGLAMYEKCQQVFLSGDRNNLKSILENLADNGKPIIAESQKDLLLNRKMQSQGERLLADENNFQTTKRIIERIATKNPKHGPARIEYSDVISLQEQTRGSGEYSNIQMMKELRIMIPLEETSDILDMPEMKGRSITKTRDKVVIVLIRRDGIWYWNPFGW